MCVYCEYIANLPPIKIETPFRAEGRTSRVAWVSMQMYTYINHEYVYAHVHTCVYEHLNTLLGRGASKLSRLDIDLRHL